MPQAFNRWYNKNMLYRAILELHRKAEKAAEDVDYIRNKIIELQQLKQTEEIRKKIESFQKKFPIALKKSSDLWEQYNVHSEIKKGKIVRVVRKARTKGSPQKGTEGIVFWIGTNGWGTEKCGIITNYNNKNEAPIKAYVPINACAVIDSSIRTIKLRKQETFPFIGTLESFSQKAFLISTLDRTRAFWVPINQTQYKSSIVEIKTEKTLITDSFNAKGTATKSKKAKILYIDGKVMKRNSAISITIPLWLAKKKKVA